MRLPSETRFITASLQKAFYSLLEGDSTDQELHHHINKAMDYLEENAFCGIQIKKKLIPKEFIKKYGITNLWKYHLPRGWRLLYTVENDNFCIVCIILEWGTHKDYEKRFKY